MCAVVKGQDFDDAYRSSHPHEPNQWFLLHNRCNAAYDLVPAWVNPALVGLTLITLCCLLAAAATTVTRVRRQRGPTSVH